MNEETTKPEGSTAKRSDAAGPDNAKATAAAGRSESRSAEGRNAAGRGAVGGNAAGGAADRKRDLPIWVMLAALCVIAALVLGCWAVATSQRPDYVGRPLDGDLKEQVIAQNSPLTDYVFLTENADFPRTDPIEGITIHHMAGNLSLDGLGDKFSKRDAQASSNYAIDSDGDVALYVEEANRAWTSNDRDIDERTVTIEVANDELYGDWHVSDEAFEALVELCADICRRNGIERLNFTNDLSGNLYYHNMMDESTECPGPYLTERMQDLADAVNERLGE